MLLSEQLKQAKPYFAEQKLEALTPELIDIVNQFASSVFWIDSTSVAVGDVIGTIHPDYQGKSWEWLLNNGRRMSHNLELLNNNSKYYLETIKKEPSMYYIKINDKLYVGADGNHRTCIAKYLSDIQCNTLIYGITLDEYIVDFSLIAAYKDLIEFVKSKRLSLNISVVKKHINRQDGTGWKRDNYKIEISITNIKNNQTIKVFSCNEIYSIINSYRGLLSKFFGEHKKLY